MLQTEFIPAAQPGSRRLMLVLHGLGDSLAGYRWLPQLLGLPWLNYLLVNAPDEYYGGYSWYDFAGQPGPGIRRSRQLLSTLIDQQAARGYAPEQVALFGFSQGCLMTLDTGLRYPARLAALIGISGYLYEPETLLKELSPVATEQKILVTHGTQDSLIPFAAVREQYQLLKARGLNIQWREFDKAHTIAGEEELMVIRKFLNHAYGES